MDKRLFYIWLKQFIKATGSRAEDGHRSLLLIDSDGSHISYRAWELAVSHGVHIISLPPNATHVVQTLDVSVFCELSPGQTRVSSSCSQCSTNEDAGHPSAECRLALKAK